MLWFTYMYACIRLNVNFKSLFYAYSTLDSGNSYLRLAASKFVVYAYTQTTPYKLSYGGYNILHLGATTIVFHSMSVSVSFYRILLLFPLIGANVAFVARYDEMIAINMLWIHMHCPTGLNESIWSTLFEIFEIFEGNPIICSANHKQCYDDKKYQQPIRTEGVLSNRVFYFPKEIDTVFKCSYTYASLSYSIE